MTPNYSSEDAEATACRAPFQPYREPPFEAYQAEPRPYPPSVFPSNSASPHQLAAKGFAQMFALHPIFAFFAIIVDGMVSAIDVSTLEITAPVLWLIAAVVVSVVVYRGQQKFAGDDAETSLIKAIMVGFLVALPTPFPAFLTVPSAIAGTVQILRNRK